MFYKKAFLNISQYSQENTYVGFSFEFFNFGCITVTDLQFKNFQNVCGETWGKARDR